MKAGSLVLQPVGGLKPHQPPCWMRHWSKTVILRTMSVEGRPANGAGRSTCKLAPILKLAYGSEWINPI
jgi:hypothetical protein